MDPISRTVPLEEALPDMVLAEDLRQPDGGLLLPVGFRLGAVQIKALRQRGILAIVIAIPATEVDGDPVALRLAREEAVRSEIAHMFRKSESDIATQALIRAVLEYRLEKIE